MKRVGGIALCGALVAALGACSTHSLEELRRTDPKGNAFQVTLANLYLDFATEEEKNYDWKDSWHFADKGLLAAYGHNVAPESLEAWDIPAEALPDLQEARTRMVSALTPEAIQAQPELAAQIVFNFDCWVEQQEENWQPEDIAECRDGFAEALTEFTVGPGPEEDAPGAPVQASPKPEKSKKKTDAKAKAKQKPKAAAVAETSAKPVATAAKEAAPKAVPVPAAEAALAAEVQKELVKEALQDELAETSPSAAPSADMLPLTPAEPVELKTTASAKPEAKTSAKPGSFNPPSATAAPAKAAAASAQQTDSYLLYFGEESSAIPAPAQEILNMLGASMGKDAGYSLAIVVRDSNAENPSKLFASRAQSVKQHLVSLGVNPKAITIVSPSSGTPNTTTSRKVELFIHD
jgi:outer membrane protein OmpA-like peptidoglycan-associated protein